MPNVPVVLSAFQYPIVERLRAEGAFGAEDADIVKRVFLEWCGEHGIEPKAAPAPAPAPGFAAQPNRSPPA